MLERDIASVVNAYAISKGWEVQKSTVFSDPDWKYYCNGYVFLIEFKREGEKLRKAQDVNAKQWQKNGFNTYCVSNGTIGIHIIDLETRHANERKFTTRPTFIS